MDMVDSDIRINYRFSFVCIQKNTTLAASFFHSWLIARE
jgi:hypothetical protein